MPLGPAEYINSGKYKNSKFNYTGNLSDLEKSLLGFTFQSSVKGQRRTASRDSLYETAFYFLRSNDPKRISGIIDDTISKLEELSKGNSIYVDALEAKEYERHFKKLRFTSPRKIAYEDFEPKGHKNSVFKQYIGFILYGLSTAKLIDIPGESRKPITYIPGRHR